MPQYILKYPIDGKIYNANNPKDAGKKAFLDLCRYNNYDQSRITVIENNSKKEYNFLGMTDTKLDQYNQVLQSKNPIQVGGSSAVDDKEFYNKLSEISGNINLSVGELTKILKQKYEPKNDDVIVLIKDGLNKLDNINKNVDIIAKSHEKKIESIQNLMNIPMPTKDEKKGKSESKKAPSSEKSELKNEEEKEGKGCVIM